MQDNTILRFQHSDKQSYKLLFHKLYPIMCLFSKKFINDYNDTEDIVQEVFIELWEQHEKFESIEQIKAFLYLSIKTKCLNFMKHQVVKENFIKTSLANSEQLFEEQVLEAEVVRIIYNVISKPSRQRKQFITLSMH
jgi:RNA polymerase sigma factor (sigma-70 family)